MTQQEASKGPVSIKPIVDEIAKVTRALRTPRSGVAEFERKRTLMLLEAASEVLQACCLAEEEAETYYVDEGTHGK